MKAGIACVAVLALLCAAPLAGAAAQKIIFDTDFVFVPQDDAMALIFALNCPELEILGITTVAGNKNVERATADALKILEIAGREDIPVYKGAAMPLVSGRRDTGTGRQTERSAARAGR